MKEFLNRKYKINTKQQNGFLVDNLIGTKNNNLNGGIQLDS